MGDNIVRPDRSGAATAETQATELVVTCQASVTLEYHSYSQSDRVIDSIVRIALKTFTCQHDCHHAHRLSLSAGHVSNHQIRQQHQELTLDVCRCPSSHWQARLS